MPATKNGTECPIWSYAKPAESGASTRATPPNVCCTPM